MKTVLQKKLVEAQNILNQKNSNPNGAIKLLTPLVQEELTPWQAYYLYGMAMLKKGEFLKAMDYLKRAIYSGSDEHGTFYALAVAAYNSNKFDESERFAEKSVEIKKDHFESWMILGDSRRELGKLNESLLSYQRCNQINPKNVDIAYKIAQVYKDQGFVEKALEMYDIAIQMDGMHLGAINEKTKILTSQKRYEEALETIEAGLNIEPDNFVLQGTCAELKKETGDYTQALSIYDGILKNHPKNAAIRVNYANILKDLGRFDEAEENYLQANKDFPPLMESFSNYLFVQHYNPKKTKEEIFEAHKKWDTIYAPENPQRPIPQDKDPERTLRVGLISGGFRKHPVGWMITPGLEKLDQSKFELYFYSNFNQVDEITKKLHAISSQWHMATGISDEQLNLLIRQDKIDILIDLSGHASETRLRAVAMEPAPIIVKWVGGLINTTGLKAIDFLISDSIETPEGVEPFYLEKLVRMPDDYICFKAPEYAPDVSESPYERNGFITFGCFNNPIKVNDVLLEKWAELMKKVPESRLFLKSKQYANTFYIQRVQEVMKGFGIGKERLIFEGDSPHVELLKAYHRVDIALDPWPYSGGLTTCEALWMGAPVITKPGDTFAGRHSATHLHNAGFSNWIADSWDEYVIKAVELASDTDKLSVLRTGMRDKVAASPLCDAGRFGTALGHAFREMWRQRVDGYRKEARGEWKKSIDLGTLPEDSRQIPKVEAGEAATTGLQGDLDLDQGELSDKYVVTNRKGKDHNFWVTTKDGLMISVPESLEVLTTYVMLEQGQWLDPDLDFLADYLKPGMNFVDVGAGFGVYSLPAAKRVGKKGKVYSFEPGADVKKHLEMSRIENGFENLEIIGEAVSDTTGKQNWETGETPEQNKLAENGEEEVNTITLDDWWQLEGEPTVDFLKVDVNGKEADVIKGASELLQNQSPVLIISITEQKADAFVKELKEHGYTLYEYISGPGILVQYETELGAGPYMPNLIAIPKSRMEEIIKVGWLHDKTVTPKEVDQDLWKRELGKQPWTIDLMERWESYDESEEIMNYLQGLNYLIAAEQIDVRSSEFDQPRSQKAILLLSAAKIFIQLYNQGISSTSVVFTLVRALNALGKRGQAVDIMQKLIETTNLGQKNMDVGLPFMLPIPEQDKTPIKTDLNKWLMVKTVEAWILLKDLTTYWSGEKEQKLLEVLEGNPEAGEEILRSIKINRMFRKPDEKNGQYESVRLKNQRNEKGLEFSASSELQKEVNDFQNVLNGRKVIFIPNGHGGNYGVIQGIQNQIFRHLKHLGINTEWAMQNPHETPDLKEIYDCVLRNRHDSVFFTGIYWYDMAVNKKNGTTENLFDRLNIPVISLLGDHPYTSFMQSRITNSSDKGLMISYWESLLDEFRFLKPGQNQVKSLNKTKDTIETIGADWNHNRHYVPHHYRELDLLIPLGLIKFSENRKDKLFEDAKNSGSEYSQFAKTVLGEVLTDVNQSILELAIEVHQNCFGRDWEVQNEWDEHTSNLTRIIGEIDWIVRQKRRNEMLSKLLKSKAISDLKIAITLPEDYKSLLPEGIEHLDLKFLGILPGQKLEEYYGNSRFVLHSNLTFTDAVHERVRMASYMGAAVITDPSPGLHLFNREQKSLIFRSFGETYEKIDFSLDASEMIGRRAFKVAKDKADADRYLAILLENWTEYLREN